jgi:NADPH:quinone reductase-like Zn-dependent oxidoreductase
MTEDAMGSIPHVMRAVRLHVVDGGREIAVEEIETPQPRHGEALVRVHAAAITRDELDWPADRLPAIPSYEFSGVVALVSPDVEDIAAGDSVFALSAFDRDGAAAEYIAVPSRFLASKPRTLDHTEAAAVPLAALSAWQGLFDHGHLTAGQRVLIHGVGGGVGSFAAQLARNAGAHVIGTVSPRNVDVARTIGVEQLIDHTAIRFEDVLDPVDLVFDTAGGARLERSPAVVRPGGRLVSVAAQPSADQAAERGIAAIYFVVEPSRMQLLKLAALIDDDRLRPIIDRVFPLTEARAAFDRSMGDHGAGKIVLRVREA